MENKPHHRVGGAPPSNYSPITATTIPAPTTSKAAAEIPPLGPRRRATGVKRKANNSNYSSSSKRSRGKSFTPLPHINHNHNGPVTRARQSPNKAAAAAAAAAVADAAASGGGASSSSYSVATGVGAVGDLDKPSEPLLHSTPPGSAIGEVTTNSLNLIANEDDLNETLDPNIDAEFKAIRSRDSNVHVVPTPAAWFSWTKVHPIEERALPSFFNGKLENRTSDIYMEIRNSIMKKFHSDPKTQIDLKDLSELSVGDLDAREDVMEFLDHWGLINFHPFPIVASDMTETNTAISYKAAHDKLYQFEVAMSWPLVDPKVDLSTQAMPPRLIPESSIAEEVRPEGPAVEYHCNSCSADCSRKRYHCQKQADFDLCSECYNNGMFDSGMSPADFILMEPAEVPGVSGGSWTDQETLLLLEALELFGENWNEIAEHVATKSKAQCILHFVQMPIEDTFLEGKDDFDASLQENADPGSIDEDSSALKETIETAENKSVSNTDLSSLKESHETMERNAMIDGPTSLNRSLELTESKSAAEDTPVSPKVDASDPRDGTKIKIDQEISANYAINVLKEAFEAVGSEESIAFADAGNPVMALAAFLSGLVKTDTAAASAQSSVNVSSEDSPGIQLALRHCIILDNLLEDLPSESADIEMLDVSAKQDGIKSQQDKFQKEDFHAQNNVLVEAQKDMEMRDVETQKDGDNQKDKILNHLSVGAQKDKDQKEDSFQVHNKTKGLDGINVTKDCTNKKLEDTVTKETVVPVSCPDQGEVNSAATEIADVIKMGDTTPGTMNKLSDSALPGKEQLFTEVVNKEISAAKAAKELYALDSKDSVAPCDAKKADDLTNKDNVASRATKESDDVDNKEDAASCAAKEPDDVGNKVDVASCAAKEPADVTNKKEFASCASKEADGVINEDVASGTITESNDSAVLRKDQPNTIDGLNGFVLPSDVASSSVEVSTALAPPEEVSQISKMSNDADMDSGTVHFENKDLQRTVTPSLAIETGTNTGDCGSKVECKTEKACNFSETKGDNNIEKIKRASLSALSAAAVKAKLLADEEEMQIRRLATNLIHKQLYKIETKLAFYADMENAIIRAKEQMDRSRQKLYHERAQIIAARLGLPATSSRAMPSSLPINRVAMGYTNTLPKSLPNMNSQNNSVTSITNTSAPPGAAPGSSTRSSH